MATLAEKRDLYTLMEMQKERRANDPLLTWEPHPKQRQFIQAVLHSDVYENWALWANRAGKTDVGAYCGAYLARFGTPNPRPSVGPSVTVWDRATSGWVVSLDFPASRDVVQPKYFDNGYVPGSSTHPPFIPAHEIEKDGWSVTNQTLRLRNGSIIGFKSADSGRKKFQGVEKDWVHIDEEPAKEIRTEISIRVGAGKRLRIFGTCTLLPPEGQVGGVTWIYTDIVKPVQAGEIKTIGIYTASIYDNPHIPREEIARLESIYPDGSEERRIRLKGELLPGIGGSRAYGSFNQRLHVRDLGQIDPRRPLCWALDFNVSPMVSVVGQRHDRQFFVYAELIAENGGVPAMVQLFKNLYPTHNAELWIYGDATGTHRNAQTGQSNYALIAASLLDYPVPFRLKVPHSNPLVVDRLNAVNRAFVDEQGFVGVVINESCTELIADFEDVLRDPKGGIKKTYNAKDSYFRRTHTSDAFGYWVWAVQPVSVAPLAAHLNRPSGSSGPSIIKMPGFKRA